jgi:hypothetical protein
MQTLTDTASEIERKLCFGLPRSAPAALLCYLRVAVSADINIRWRGGCVQVMQSIDDNITEEDLLAEIDKALKAPVYANDLLNGRGRA